MEINCIQIIFGPCTQLVLNVPKDTVRSMKARTEFTDLTKLNYFAHALVWKITKLLVELKVNVTYVLVVLLEDR